MDVINNIKNRLKYLIEFVPEKILSISDDELKMKPSDNKWSKKENLGHLIDSAANNHQRFIAVQYGQAPSLELFRQDEWINIQRYNDEETKNLVNLWASYNRHLLHIISNFAPDKLGIEFRMNDKDVTLLTLIHNYLKHTEHHLIKILGDI